MSGVFLPRLSSSSSFPLSNSRLRLSPSGPSAWSNVPAFFRVLNFRETTSLAGLLGPGLNLYTRPLLPVSKLTTSEAAKAERGDSNRDFVVTYRCGMSHFIYKWTQSLKNERTRSPIKFTSAFYWTVYFLQRGSTYALLHTLRVQWCKRCEWRLGAQLQTTAKQKYCRMRAKLRRDPLQTKQTLCWGRRRGGINHWGGNMCEMCLPVIFQKEKWEQRPFFNT